MRLKVRRCGGKAQRQACREALFTILSLKNMVSKNTKNEDWTFQIQPKGEPYSKPVFQTQAWILWHFWSLRFERVRNSPHTPLPPLPPRQQWLRIWRSGKLEKITMQIEFEKMKLNHINTALFSLANLHKPCRRYMIFPYFSLVFSWCSWRHRESSSACIHHYDSTSSSHHLRSPAPLLFLLSKIIISSSNIGFILIQHLREQGAFLSTRDLRMPATICVSNDHLDGGSGVSTPYDCSTDRWRSQGLFLRLLGSTMFDPPS